MLTICSMNAYVAFGDSQFIRRMFRSTFIYRPTICLPAHVNVDDFTVSSVGITAAPDDEVQLPKKLGTQYPYSLAANTAVSTDGSRTVWRGDREHGPCEHW